MVEIMQGTNEMLRRCSFRGYYSEGNAGDDALLLTSRKLMGAALESHQAPLNAAASVSGRLDGVKATRFLVYGGGTQFFSFDRVNRSWTSRAGTLARYLHARVRNTIPAFADRRTARPTAILALGIGLGPFADCIDAQQAVIALAQSQLLWVRDDRSHEFCRNHGLTWAIRSSDLCFTRVFRELVRSKSIDADGRAPRVAFVLRDWPIASRGRWSAFLEAACNLRAEGIDVTFVSMSVGDRHYRSDLTGLGEAGALWGGSSEVVHDFVASFGQYDLVISMRFHGLVFAALCGVPFVPVGIDPKLNQFQSYFAGDSLEADCSAEDILYVVRRAFRCSDEWNERVAHFLGEQGRLAEQGVAELNAQIGDAVRW